MMTVVDIYALIAYLILDLFAVMSVVGSGLMLAGSVISTLRGRRFRAPEQIFMWGVGGLVFGIAGVVAINFSEQVEMEKTLFLEFSMTTLHIIFGASALLLIVGKVVQSRVRRVSFAKPRRFVKQERW